MSFSKGRGLGSTPHGKHILFMLLFSLQWVSYISLRNFVATQTKGVSSAIYQKFPSKVDAEATYRQAVEDGHVEVL